METFFIILLVWLVIAIAIGAWAESRGRSGMGFALLSFFTTPVLAGIVLLILKDLVEEARREARAKIQQDRQREEDAISRRQDHEKQVLALKAIASTRVDANPQSGNISSELEKLAKLRQDGILSQEEFQTLKDKLLA